MNAKQINAIMPITVKTAEQTFESTVVLSRNMNQIDKI